MYLKCRTPRRSADDLEDFVRVFLLDSFDSEFVYIVSPWISTFKFTKKIIYYPYISSYDIVDILRAIHVNNVDVKVLVRCFDDFLSPDLIYILYMIYTRKLNIPSDITLYLKQQLERIIRRLEMAEKIINIGIDFRTDLGVNDRSWYRLHAKIYVNEKWGLMGSANFSRGGLIRDGNWECLLMVDSNSQLYNELLKYAKQLLSVSKSFNECERRIVNTINRYLRGYGVKIHTFDDLKLLLKELYKSLI